MHFFYIYSKGFSKNIIKKKYLLFLASLMMLNLCKAQDTSLQKPVEGENNHTRAIFYVRGNFRVVVDRINTDRPRKIEALWHWHPACKVLIKEHNIVSTQNENRNLEIIGVGPTSWSVNLVKGQEHPDIQWWYSKEDNEYLPNTSSIYSTEINKSTAFVWILYPSENDLPEVHARITSENMDSMTLKVSNPEERNCVLKIPFSSSKDTAFEISKIKNNNYISKVKSKNINTKTVS